MVEAEFKSQSGCLVKDNLPPLKWLIARIIRIPLNGKVHVIKFKTKHGIRSITKVCPLPIENYDCQDVKLC